MTYYVTADEHSYLIREPNGIDEGPYSDRGDSGSDVYLRSISLSKPNGWYEEVSNDSYTTPYDVDDIAPGNVAYVVLVSYTDGDTFGSSGYWCVAAVVSDPERAKEIAKRCENENDSPLAYRPWDGYFASLNSAEVVALLVNP